MPGSANWTADRFYIPDTLANWPWPRAINPAYEECKAASAAWCEKYGAFSARAQKAFNLCDFNLLASLAYAGLPADVNRVGCDLMNLFFVVDEHTDAMDARSVQDWVDIVVDALHHPHTPRPAGEPKVGEIARTFWENGIKCMGPTAQRRFVETFTTYLQSVVTQAQDRDKHLFRDVDSYMEVRRDTIGAKPSFALLEHDMELPDDVFYHPLLEKLREWAIDMLILGNDLCSYNVEQSRGDDGHNIIRLAMLQENTNVHGALRFVSKMHDDLAEKFLSNYQGMPSFTPQIDAWVTRYIDGLGNWVRANDSWSFESWRYFKGDVLRVQAERWVELLPPAPKDELTSSIPPESRWIKPAVEPSRARPNNVGIVALDTYTPTSEDDFQTLAVKTVSSLLSKYNINPVSVGRLDICIERAADPYIIYALRDAFASAGNTDVEAIVSSSKSVVGLFNAINWVESSSWDGRYAIVFAGDLSSGVSAALVGPDAPIVVEPTRGTYLGDPIASTDEAQGSYIDSLFQSYSHYRKKHPQFSKTSGAPNGAHTPTTTNGSIKSNGFVSGDTNGHANGNGHVQTRSSTPSSSSSSTSSPSFDYMILHDRHGKIPTGAGSIYLGLASLITDIAPETLAGKSIGVFGFANSTSTFFGIRVAGDCSVICKQLQA
ncbi:unnamed protein product [Cyclocybe aegerita]|uniref:Delta(6)-protoilludene synthase n=2 Tax=Cyclocybe aegerita TaxID=1973307 RepID=AGR6_CYCAE|nr:RecName: Full=Delta(6)-protoilludene synthase; AltName: Full=Terpene cyclase Agr6 [Cyclocybe aegerita]CAA7261880.1 unnamed protein product [Cyclocybe aegerita]